MTDRESGKSGSTSPHQEVQKWVEGEDRAPSGFVFLTGAAGSGKTRLLRTLDSRSDETLLVDAAGLSAEQVFLKIVELLDVPYDLYERNPVQYANALRRARIERVVAVGEVHLAGGVRTSSEPGRVMRSVVWALGAGAARTGVRLIAEVDSSVAPLPKKAPAISLDGAGTAKEESPPLPDPHSVESAALRALAQAELRTLRLEEWCALAEIIGVRLDVEQVRRIAEELGSLSLDGDTVRFRHEGYAHRIRRAMADEGREMNDRIVAALRHLPPGPLASYAARALPAHAARSGIFEQVISDPRVLVACERTALLEPLPLAFPDGIPVGSLAADIHYLDKLGIAPDAHEEWIAFLHRNAVCRNDLDTAEALDRAVDLPWRTEWARWRRGGQFTPSPDHVGEVESLVAVPGSAVVESTGSTGARRRWNALTGAPAEAPDDASDAAQGATTAPAPAPVWEADTGWNKVDLRRSRASATHDTRLTLRVPGLNAAAVVGDVVVLGGTQGVYAVTVPESDPRTAPSPATATAPAPAFALPMLAPHGFVATRPYRPADDCRPTHERLCAVFGADRTHRPAGSRLPDGLTHQPSRDFLREVGFPQVELFLGLTTLPLSETGLEEVDWGRSQGAERPDGEGPFYLLGEWIEGVLCLDGTSGAVHRAPKATALDAGAGTKTLVGTSLAHFTAMVALHWQRMVVYDQSGNLDSEELLAELADWLKGIAPAAGTSAPWQHVLDPDNFDTL
ncbi:SUKH-4 family immunity protein [Streptomyces sp. NPDC059008]|uniref:SUKH-4 family immunity protein n=1 Tax=Streptomyces sp. NPDC059008 TaxID=3346693 RepID=UPI003682662F